VTVEFSRGRKLAAEALGSFLLAATVIGSGVMAERLSAGNDGVALLANTMATMAALYVLIVLLRPISGAQFNPAVTLAMRLRRQIGMMDGLLYVVAQIAGMILGAWAAHAMFDLPLAQLSHKSREGGALLFAELVASFGLLTTIWLGLRFAPRGIPALVACWIGAAYWFTSSTSFANPAITIARALSDTFAGIRPQDAPAFIAAQFAGALVATAFCGWLIKEPGKTRLPADPSPT
jgi:glycerol uptake facilitator-like aquaporin